MFCIDVSGSMDQSERSGGLMARGVPHAAMGRAPTRLDLIKKAVAEQIQQMIQQNPRRHVGVVTFSEQVRIIGL